MRVRNGLVAVLVFVAASAGADAATYSTSNANLTGTATAPTTAAADTDFDVVVTGERTDGSANMWALYRDATWTTNTAGQVTVTSGTWLAGTSFGFDNPWSHTVTENLPAGAYTYLYVFAELRAHKRYDLHLEFAVTVGSTATAVDVDIKPGSCPNPLNVGSKGVVSVAVLGSADLDVGTIDPETVTLAGVHALRWSEEDVAAPVADRETPCECTTAGPDGSLDLVLKVDKRALVEALGDVEDGDEVFLPLAGVLLDGGGIAGGDCVVIRRKP